MYDMMKKQNFGVEIELTGITREQAANVIATYFGTQTRYLGTYYDTYGATDRKGRTWKAMSDGSIYTERKTSRGKVTAGREYSCEVVTPVLQYEDMEDLQNVIRALREAGAIANSSCGIHVHVDGKNHTPASLTRLMNFAIGRQDLFYEALEIGDRANRWCKKMNSTLLKAMQNDSEKTKSSIERIWYSSANDGYTGGINHEHYNTSRYLLVRGKKVKGMAYVMTPGHRITAPMQQYLDTILEGYKDFGFDPAPLLDAAAEARKGE